MILPEPHTSIHSTPKSSAIARASSIGIDGCMSTPACSLISSIIVARRNGGSRSTSRSPTVTTVVPLARERGLGDERLGQLHHVVVVAERLVGLEQRELGVVAGVEPLVAEDAADLEHAVHAADEQPLQRQLERDPQVHLDVERVVVGDERARRRAAGLAQQHRRLDLAEAAVEQRLADRGDRDRARARRSARVVVVDDQVDVAVAVARLRVGQAVAHVRAAGAAPSTSSSKRRDVDRQLAASRRDHARPRRRPSRRGRARRSRARRSSPTSSRETSSWIVPVSSQQVGEVEPAVAAHRHHAARRRAPSSPVARAGGEARERVVQLGGGARRGRSGPGRARCRARAARRAWPAAAPARASTKSAAPLDLVGASSVVAHARMLRAAPDRVDRSSGADASGRIARRERTSASTRRRPGQARPRAPRQRRDRARSSLTALGIASRRRRGHLRHDRHGAPRSTPGPAVIISFLLAGLAAAVTALCYAEMAAMIPAAGSTYSYAYATFGIVPRLVHRLGPAARVPVRRLDRRGRLGGLLRRAAAVDRDHAAALAHQRAVPATTRASSTCRRSSIVLLTCGLLVRRHARVGAGEQRDGRAQAGGPARVRRVRRLATSTRANWEPVRARRTRASFGDFGITGVLRAAGVVFFAYVGFDAVSTAAAEARRPAAHDPDRPDRDGGDLDRALRR